MDRHRASIALAGVAFTAAGICGDTKRACAKCGREVTKGNLREGYTDLISALYLARDCLGDCINDASQAIGDADE